MGRNKLLRCLKNVTMPSLPLGPQIIIFTQYLPPQGFGPNAEEAYIEVLERNMIGIYQGIYQRQRNLSF
jgi:hypothetical protein